MKMNLLKEMIYRLRGDYTTEKLISMGLKVGKNFHRLHGTTLDPSHCWLIEIGDNVTMAPCVHVLAHDASTKRALGYTKIGRVTIGNNVFVGAATVILPGVHIGNDVIIGANSTVTHDIPEGSVAVGSPARVICTTEEYINKERERMKLAPVYDETYTLSGNITADMRQKQRDELLNMGGFIK